MAKQNKGRRRRKNSKHYSSDINSNGNSDSDSDSCNSNSEAEHLSRDETRDSKSSKNDRNNKSELSFAERRELQRKAAAEKRRQKMKCYLCGKTGHVRRECPGIADDGRGESKYTKSHGDAGAVHLKHKGRKKYNNNSNIHNNNNGTNVKDGDLVLPSGFDKKQSLSESNFFYYDAGFGDGQATLEYLRFGRHGHGTSGRKSNGHNKHNKHNNNNNSHNHTKLSRKDAILEYDTAMKGVCDTTNFGGCIVRSFLPLSASATPTEEPWNPQDSFPFLWSQDTPELLKFVIGYHIGFDDEASLDSEAMVDRLVNTANIHKRKIVGFFADLDYRSFDKENSSEQINDKRETFRAFQMERLRNTLKAASKVDCPVQIRIEPGYKPCRGESDNIATTAPSTDGYSQAIRDLGKILLEASVHSWKVHLSSWNGKAEHLVALSGAFSSSPPDENDTGQQQKQKQHQQHLVFGFDGSLGFSKAIHLHESAFEVSPRNILLETGGPGILPPIVAKHCGRNAFCHSGHIPFVAEELAKHLSKNARNTIARDGNNEIDERTNENGDISAETVARWASVNTKALYNRFAS